MFIFLLTLSCICFGILLLAFLSQNKSKPTLKPTRNTMDTPKIHYAHVYMERERGNSEVCILARTDGLLNQTPYPYSFEVIMREATIAYTADNAAIAICDPERPDKETGHIDCFQRWYGRHVATARLESMLQAHIKANQTHPGTVAQPNFHDFPRKTIASAVNEFLIELRKSHERREKPAAVVV